MQKQLLEKVIKNFSSFKNFNFTYTYRYVCVRTVSSVAFQILLQVYLLLCLYRQKLSTASVNSLNCVQPKFDVSSSLYGPRGFCYIKKNFLIILILLKQLTIIYTFRVWILYMRDWVELGCVFFFPYFIFYLKTQFFLTTKELI